MVARSFTLVFTRFGNRKEHWTVPRTTTTNSWSSAHFAPLIFFFFYLERKLMCTFSKWQTTLAHIYLYRSHLTRSCFLRLFISFHYVSYSYRLSAWLNHRCQFLFSPLSTSPRHFGGGSRWNQFDRMAKRSFLGPKGSKNCKINSLSTGHW